MLAHLIAAFLMAAEAEADAPAKGGEANLLVLDNGLVRVAADLESGGAITGLYGGGDSRNLINNYDRGRQVQQSYYAGAPLDRRDEGQSPNWSPWPWNPIQVGDAFGNSSEVIEHSNDGETIYTKTVPLLWDMRDEAGECHFETWITLDRHAVHVRNKLTTFRTDDRWSVAPRHQELPAVYGIGDLYEIYTYEGDAPFTRDELTERPRTPPPWSYWTTPENWAALVEPAPSLWGIGIYNAEQELFIGGFAGSPGGETLDSSTGYLSPLRTLSLEKDTVYEYEYDLLVGTLDQIRAFVYNAEGHPDYDEDGLTYDQETMDLDPDTPGIQNPFDPGAADTTGDDGSLEPDGAPDGENDFDGDGYSNAEEQEDGTPMLRADAEDINRSRNVDAVDVQLAINAALGLDIAPWRGDVDQNGAVDAVDVQRVINAALGVAT